jgi:hypothetical protein
MSRDRMGLPASGRTVNEGTLLVFVNTSEVCGVCGKVKVFLRC